MQCNENIRVVSDLRIFSSSLTNHCYQAVIRGAVLKVTKRDNILCRAVPRIPTTLPTANSKHHQRTNESVNAVQRTKIRETRRINLQLYNSNNECCYDKVVVGPGCIHTSREPS